LRKSLQSNEDKDQKDIIYNHQPIQIVNQHKRTNSMSAYYELRVNTEPNPVDYDSNSFFNGEFMMPQYRASDHL
jgi:hypothetical protein